MAAFFATCAWVSAYPSFSELFPTPLRATGIGASVFVGRIGAIIGQVLLAETASSFSVGTMFTVLGLFWLIGAAAGCLWWRFGVEHAVSRSKPSPSLGRSRREFSPAVASRQ